MGPGRAHLFMVVCSSCQGAEEFSLWDLNCLWPGPWQALSDSGRPVGSSHCLSQDRVTMWGVWYPPLQRKQLLNHLGLGLHFLGLFLQTVTKCLGLTHITAPSQYITTAGKQLGGKTALPCREGGTNKQMQSQSPELCSQDLAGKIF